MSGTYYDGELAELGNTFFAAMSANIEPLKLAIASAAESSIIGVGSGGSFTVASLLCNLHELYTGASRDRQRRWRLFVIPRWPPQVRSS